MMSELTARKGRVNMAYTIVALGVALAVLGISLSRTRNSASSFDDVWSAGADPVPLRRAARRTSPGSPSGRSVTEVAAVVAGAGGGGGEMAHRQPDHFSRP